ncbi:MAG: ferritin family protein [Anaerolineales bacterium]
MQNNSIEELFHLAIALERAAESFYRGLAAKFESLPEVVVFWRKYEREEGGHARFLEELLGRLSPEKKCQPASIELIASARRLLYPSPEALLAGITNLEEAYQGAFEIEHNETNLIFETLITDFAVTSQAVTFLKRQLREHADGLSREFPPPYDSAVVRRTVKAGS